MYEKSLEILSRRRDALESRVEKSVLSGHIGLLSTYYRSAIDLLNRELAEAKKDIGRLGEVNEARKDKLGLATYYYRSLTYKLELIRNLIFVIERDISPSEAAISQSLHRPEHHILCSLIDEITTKGPACVLSISDEFKCWNPGELLNSSEHSSFSFVSLPDSYATSPLMYPIIFHEVGHASLSLRDGRLLFRESIAKLDELENEYELRISSSGAQSKKIVNEQWLILDQWRRWALELYCDCFASWVVGPAYLISMVHHLYGTDPHDFWYSHPPLRLRMMVVQTVLDRTGIAAHDITSIDNVLNEYSHQCGYEEGPKFKLAANSHVIEAAVNDLTRAAGEVKGSLPESGTSTALRLMNQYWKEVLLGKTGIDKANDALYKLLKEHYNGN